MSWEHIRGWFDWQWLYDDVVANAPQRAVLVEVGVCFGRSLAYLARRAIEADRRDLAIIGIDSWVAEDWLVRDHADLLTKHGCELKVGAPFYRAFQGEMHEHASLEMERVMHSILPSVVAARTLPIEPHFVYVDGDHSTAAVEADIDAWLPKIAPGGMLAGHDFGNFGVEPAVRKKFGTKFTVRGSTWMVRR